MVAILASMIVFVALALLHLYFLNGSWGHPFASILGAVFFIANGFFFNHMAAGHVTFQLYLFPVILIIIVHPNSRLAGRTASLVYCRNSAVFRHPRSYLLYIDRADLFSTALSAQASLLDGNGYLQLPFGGHSNHPVCGSKLWAAYSFMRFFPRLAQDNYTTTLWTGMVGIVHQLLGTMTWLLFIEYCKVSSLMIRCLHGEKYRNIYAMGVDQSLSPALLFLLQRRDHIFYCTSPR